MNATAPPRTAGTHAQERRVGDRIEKYELLRSVAQGGMGSVWAARLHGPHGFEKTVAIKAVLPELAGDPRARAMFLDEARLASAIVHRNVAQVLDFLEHEKQLYIVMEWVDGISLVALHDRLAAIGARIPVGIVLRTLADACAGLHAAHELTFADGEPCGLVHRDVSPSNVLVAIEGSAKLIDFGVARTRFSIASESPFGYLRGRLAFMAPEQAHSEALDRRADIWSVGASLFHLLTGQGPFGPSGPDETLRLLLRNAPPRPPPPDVHPSVARVLSGCLAQRREDRFPTAQHLGWAIEEAIQDMAVSATATDVAEFLADRSEVTSVRVMKSGCRRALNRSAAARVTEAQPIARRGRKTASVRRTLTGCAIASVLSLAIAGSVASGALETSVPLVSAGPVRTIVLKARPAPHDTLASREASADGRPPRARRKVRSVRRAEPKGEP